MLIVVLTSNICPLVGVEIVVDQFLRLELMCELSYLDHLIFEMAGTVAECKQKSEYGVV